MEDGIFDNVDCSINLYYNGKNRLLEDGKKIKKVIIVDGVTSIENDAFYGYTGITEVTIPPSVKSIGNSAFAECTSLKKVTIPLSVTFMGMYVFIGSPNVTMYVASESEAEYYAARENIRYISMKAVDINSQIYTGNKITPNIIVKVEDKVLVKGKDYEVSFKNNINVGTATITITGKGDYLGTVTKTFEIVAKDISKVTATINTENKTYTGNAITTSVELKDGTKKLVEGTDYTVAYKNNIKPGKATVTITGKGNYIGEISKVFLIIEKNISDIKINADTSDKLYTGEEIEPNIELTYEKNKLIEGRDYIVLFQNNIDIGTATLIIVGRGNYTGTITKTFKIVAKPVQEETQKLGDVNGDGQINTLDAVMILQSVAKKITLNNAQKTAADVNKDGKVDTLDAVRILQFVAKKINNL